MGIGFSEEEAGYVRKLHTGHTNQLRLLHYPAMPQQIGHDYRAVPQQVGHDEGHSRLGAHTDWRYDCSKIPESGYLNLFSQWQHSSFTFLFQDSHQGLEFLDRETGEFIAATPKPDTLYINIGDMFMRLSNGTSNCLIRSMRNANLVGIFPQATILQGRIALSYRDLLALRAIRSHILYLRIPML